MDSDTKRDNVPIRRFKKYLIEHIQKNLEQNSSTQLNREQSRVADIAFAFHNREMLVLLKKRYEYLCKAKFEKAEKVEEQLTKIKNEKFDQLIVPNTFYCTFMEGLGQ